MFSYSVMKMFPEHIDEICADVTDQYERGIASEVLFLVKLVPEGDPPIDKAAEEGELFDRFAAKLPHAGILVQCTIGHGYPLDEMFPFQPCIGLKDGKKTFTVCPYDPGARAYFRKAFASLAAHRPSVIMVDDDFRLLARSGIGCACPLHMAQFSRRAGVSMTREELLPHLLNRKNDPADDRLARIFEETQLDSLIGCAREMRAGIDSVDPALPGLFCTCGFDPSGEIARILAGKGNPSVIRVNNGNYTAPGARNLSYFMGRAAMQIHLKANRADAYLAETDTCPQNRYSTGAMSLHAHYTGTILEGATGAKHWITRIAAYEPESGTAYRRILAKNAGFYEALAASAAVMQPLGIRLPLPDTLPTDFDRYGGNGENGWGHCVLERLGFPFWFSEKEGGAVFLDDGTPDLFDDETLRRMLAGTVVLSAAAADKLNQRGFADRTGVTVRRWQGENLSGELLHDSGNVCKIQKNARELIPAAEATESLSTVYHLKGGKEIVPLFPGCTRFCRPDGGTAVVFCGTPTAEYNYVEGFSFLNASRKKQLAGILAGAGALPVFYPGDAEVMLRVGALPGGELLCAFFNIGLDPLEEIGLVSSRPVVGLEKLDHDGRRIPVPFRTEDGRILAECPAYTLDPVILFLSF